MFSARREGKIVLHAGAPGLVPFETWESTMLALEPVDTTDLSLGMVEGPALRNREDYRRLKVSTKINSCSASRSVGS